MASEPERVVVLGAGAIGAAVGGLLHASGVRCVLVARGEHGRALEAHGVSLRFPDRALCVRVPCVERVADAAPTRNDLVVLSTMGHDTEAALADVDSVVPVASFQNGLAPLEAIGRCGSTLTLAAMVFIPAERRAPGVIALPGVPVVGSVLVGDWPDGAGPWAAWLAERLDGAGFRAEAEPSIGRWVRAKLLTNLGNIVGAVCDAPPEDVVEAAQAEARSVWRAAGDPFEEVAALLARVGPLDVAPVDGRERVGGSTRAALARGDRLETESLHRPIVRLGRVVGVPTPVNERLILVAERATREKWIPGAMEADALRRFVHAG